MVRRIFDFAKIFVFIFLVSAFFGSSAGARDDLATEDLFGPDCREYLIPQPKEDFDEKIHLISRFQNYHIGRRRDGRGFYIVPKNPRRPSIVRRSIIRLRGPLIRSEEWRLPDKEMYFVSTGFDNMKDESFLINSEVVGHMINHPGTSLDINFTQERAAEELRLTTFRWSVHDAVLATYTERKGYLSPADFYSLVAYNRDSSHNDVFALMYIPPVFLTNIDVRDIVPQLAMTIQISYLGSRNYLEPSLKGVMAARGFGYYEGLDKLPFEYRLPKSEASAVRKEFYSQFDLRTTCEMNRYMKVHDFHVQPFQDRFLLKAMRRAEDRGMKTIVVSADSKTLILYRRYGFKIWKQLPTNGEEREYLLFMKVGSPEYLKFVSRLALGSAHVWVDWRK
jgi:hypothetical protein